MKYTWLILFLFLAIEAHGKTILFLGDSLTEGYGLKKEDAFPAIIKSLAEKDGRKIEVINGGVSGSTTASGLQRLNWYLKMTKPDIMLLALGANDGLRGFDVSRSKEALTQIIKRAKKENIKVILAGMRMPPNYGKDYTEKFQKMFVELSRTEKVDLIPFLLKGVAGRKELNLPDGIHPNKEGQKIVAKTVYDFLKGRL